MCCCCVLLLSSLIGSNYGSLVWPVFEVWDKDKSPRTTTGLTTSAIKIKLIKGNDDEPLCSLGLLVVPFTEGLQRYILFEK